MIRKIFKTGNSLALTLPKKVLGELGFKLGDTAEISVSQDKSKIYIVKAKKRSQGEFSFKVRHRLGERRP